MGVREDLLAAGIVIANRSGGELEYQASPNKPVNGMARDAQIKMAMDAQPALITSSNSGIPAFLSTYLDPKLIEVLVQPMKAAEIFGEAKKGSWVTRTAMFPVIESTGQVAAYGDYSTSGTAGANFSFPQRQSYHYQVITRWGERQMEEAGLAKVDWANRVNLASVLTLNKFQNLSYFFGISGLQNYGILNDPQLPTAISPSTKTAGGTGWANATADEIIKDMQLLYADLVTRSGQLIDLDTPALLNMSSKSQTYMTKTTTLNVTLTVADWVKKNFPNWKLNTAPEYSTTGGELVQLVVNEFEGQKSLEPAFTEKLRAHPMIVHESSFTQKKSQGTWGSILYRPMFTAQMLGV